LFPFLGFGSESGIAQVYESLLNAKEMEVGQRLDVPRGLSEEAAAALPAVQHIVAEHIRVLCFSCPLVSPLVCAWP
jgi:hypothetical protein